MKKTFLSRIVASASVFSRALAIALAAAIVTASCITETSVDFAYESFEDEEGLVEVSLDVQSSIVSGGNDTARAYMATRSGSSISPNAANEDNTIYDLWIIQFDSENNTKVTRYIPDYTDESKRSVTIYPGTNQKFLYIANTNDWQLFNRQMTYDEITSATYGYDTTYGVLADVNSSLVADDDKSKVRFIMSEIITATITEDATANKAALKASLKRNVALLAIKYGTKAPVDKVSTTVIGLQVYNIPQKSSYVAHNLGLSSGDLYPDSSVNITSITPAIFDKTSDDYVGDSSTDYSDYGINNAYYYVPVNMRGRNEDLDSWSAKYSYTIDNSALSKATYYMVGYEFDDAVNNPLLGAEKYSFSFTDYVGSTEKDYELLPNYVYMFSVVFPADLTDEMMDYIIDTDNEARIRVALSSSVN